MTSTHESLLHDRLLALSPTRLEIENESHLHAGHAGSKGGASHFRVHIQADCFVGKRTVTQHRMVYDLITDLMPFPIHALALHTSIPSQGNL